MQNKIQTDKLAILILAAGSSSRLGQPKQLLEFQGKSLVNRIVEIGLAINDHVHLILGSNYDQIKNNITNNSVQVHHFKDWQEGMGSTIAFGVREIQNTDSSIKHIMMLLCDQIKTSIDLLNQLMYQHFDKQSDITACAYDETVGVPAIFNQTVFAALEQLSGERGAKSLMHHNQYRVGTIDFPEASIDIDTSADLKHLKSH